MDTIAIETANLVLRSTNANTTEANNQGFTWNNIDMRKVLGDMYDRYSVFKLTFVSWEQSNIGTFTTLDEAIVFLNMTGLEWENATYDFATKTQSNTAKVSIIYIADGTQTVQPPFTTLGLTFRKNKPFCNIRLNFTKTLDGGLSNKSFPAQQGFRFVITPIE